MPDTKTRAERNRERARYRKRRLMAVAVLAGLLLATGVSYAAIVREVGGSEAGHPAANSGEEVGSPGAARDGAQREPTAPSTDGARGPASEGTDGQVASRSVETTHDSADDPAPDDSLYVLVLGVDRRPGEAEGAPTRSDTMMLAQVSPGSGRVQLLSLPRDLLVEVEPGVEDRINMAYAYGGVERAETVVETLTGISVDRHAIVDFGGFEEGVDALGGVTLEVEEPIRLGIEGRRVYIPAGKQHLDGLEALAYARYRGTACGDLGRIKRQQRLVAALRDQALGWNTVTRLPGIVKVLHENVDTNAGIVQAISLGRALAGRGEEGGMRSFQLKGNPKTLPNGDAVLVPDAVANEKILADFRDASPTGPERDRAPAEGAPSSGC